jgi:membrane-associated phospholipid phosphatase
MSAPSAGGESSHYVAHLWALLRLSLTQLVRPPQDPRAGEAARRLLRQAVLLLAIGAVVVVVLMVGFDAIEIGLMPPRRAPSVWPARFITDFGKAAVVLWSLAALLLAVTLIAPRLRGASRARLLLFGTELQYLFLAVLLPVLTGEVIKWIVGRGRPFVGGEANAFNFVHFAGTEAYASFPSAHANTSAALAFGIASLWPRTRFAMIVYAVLIAGSRLVLLAHHPSDVVGGAVIGVIGAMVVRYWFAARRLAFAVGSDGAPVALNGPALGVAHGAAAP